MNSKLFIFILTASIIFTGCGDSAETKTQTTKVVEQTKTQIAVDKSKEAMSAIGDVVKSKVQEAKEIIITQSPKVKEIVEQKIQDVKKVVSDNLKTADTLYKPCAGCHGASSEKKALGKSAVVKGWSEDKIYNALAGYKANTYGGSMKGLMKSQVINLSDSQLKSLSTYIAKF